MHRIITISYTGLNAGGGVPKFNRDLHNAFFDRECIHFCYDDVVSKIPANGNPHALPEWEKARILNNYLLATKKITAEDIVIADGFWAMGLEHLPFAISHSHGIWGHVTKADVDAGKKPENELLHNAQISFRKRWTALNKPLTAVSNFISHEMNIQWGFKSTVINNGVDTNVWKPAKKHDNQSNIIYIVHGINDKGNINKGWKHIEAIESYWRFRSDRPVVIKSLDEFAKETGLSKQDALAQADLVVHPSGFEGNSMFILEALACGIPIIAYDVGYLYDFGLNELKHDCGEIIDSRERSPERTLQAVNRFLSLSEKQKNECSRLSRLMVNSIDQFNKDWRNYIERLENGRNK